MERNRSVACRIGGMTSGREPAGAAVLQESVTAAITSAMFDQLAETGYARMSMDGVARRAGVGKAAVYRRWPSKQAMLIDLVGAAMRRNLPEVPDAGSLAGDVRGFLEVIVAQLADPRVRRIALDVLVETTRTPELAVALHDVVAQPRRTAAAAVLTRAIDRGELPADLDRELGLDLLVAPLLVRLLFDADQVDDAYLARLTAVVVTGLSAVGGAAGG
jgi:AcrR family transcriptional regulator